MTPAGPAADANASRNARRQRGRRARWAPARSALWTVVDGVLADGDRVAIVGAGNGDDLPLAQIASRASSVTLVDIDRATAERACGRVRRGLRRRIRVVDHDVTGGAADRILSAAIAPPGSLAREPVVGRLDRSGSSTAQVDDRRVTARATGNAGRRGSEPDPAGDGAPRLPGAPFDVVIGDLLYSQLLFPALLDAEVPPARRRAILGAEGARLTAAVVGALHASAPLVVHVHDLACWGNGYDQPVELEAILDTAEHDLAAALELAARTKGPREADPRAALAALGRAPSSSALWRWPFTIGVDYLVVATVVGDQRSAA